MYHKTQKNNLLKLAQYEFSKLIPHETGLC